MTRRYAFVWWLTMRPDERGYTRRAWNRFLLGPPFIDSRRNRLVTRLTRREVGPGATALRGWCLVLVDRP
jgi:hypothetical protein